jgi:hypothetical protein
MSWLMVQGKIECLYQQTKKENRRRGLELVLNICLASLIHTKFALNDQFTVLARGGRRIHDPLGTSARP